MPANISFIHGGFKVYRVFVGNTVMWNAHLPTSMIYKVRIVVFVLWSTCDLSGGPASMMGGGYVRQCAFSLCRPFVFYNWVVLCQLYTMNDSCLWLVRFSLPVGLPHAPYVFVKALSLRQGMTLLCMVIYVCWGYEKLIGTKFKPLTCPEWVN